MPGDRVTLITRRPFPQTRMTRLLVLCKPEDPKRRRPTHPVFQISSLLSSDEAGDWRKRMVSGGECRVEGEGRLGV